MPALSLVSLLVAATVVNLLLLGAVVLARPRALPDAGEPGWAGRAARPRPPGRWVGGEFGTRPSLRPAETARTSSAVRRLLLGGTDGSLATYDRVVRVVSWVLLLAIGAIVAITGEWPATRDAILVLVVAAGVFMLVVHDLLPATVLGPARYVVEGSAGITVATLLIVLTGGPSSPFFFLYALIVVGSSLVLSARSTLLLTIVAIAGYLVGVLVDPSWLPLSTEAAVFVAINVAALVLLTYVGMVVASEQRRARDAAVHLSTVDSLTGLYNRAYLFAAVDREIQRSARSRRGFCLLMMDLDGLKPINDRYGHFHGDRVLRGVGEVISHGVRRIDTAARYGGDEFVALLPETDRAGAYVLAEKIREEVAEMAVETPTARIRTSLSIGVAVYPDDGQTADELMISADQAMFTSKSRGKNRVVGFSPAREPVGAGTGRR